MPRSQPTRTLCKTAWIGLGRAHFPPSLVILLILLIMDLTLAFSPNLDGESQLSLNSLWPPLRPRFCFLAGMYLSVCFLLAEPLESIP